MYVSMDLGTQLKFQKPMKGKFSTLKTEVWNESHIIWEPFQTLIFNYIKPYMVYFKNTKKILREKPKIH